MTAHLSELLAALERFRTAITRGEHDLASARRRLASFRLALLRLRRRAIALILSEGARTGENLAHALDAAIDALRAELSARHAIVA